MIIKVIREKEINGAIPSKIYLDGNFFCYGLENSFYKIPAGNYSVYAQTSPKFGTEKIYLNVPNRNGILFHGGNTIEDTKGCILIGKNREADTISGDTSDELFKRVDNAYKSGEKIAAVVAESTFTTKSLLLFAAAISALIYLSRK